MSVSRYRLKHLAKSGNTGAKLATKLLKETDKLLSVILLCNNFSNAAAATLVTIIAVQLYGDQQFIVMVGTLITTFLILTFSEISPKVIAAAHPEKLALSCSFLLYPLLKILYPIGRYPLLLKVYRIHFYIVFQSMSDRQENLERN